VFFINVPPARQTDRRKWKLTLGAFAGWGEHLLVIVGRQNDEICSVGKITLLSVLLGALSRNIERHHIPLMAWYRTISWSRPDIYCASTLWVLEVQLERSGIDPLIP
jgi:hypothetical protein